MYGLLACFIAFLPRYATPTSAMMEATVMATSRMLVALGATLEPVIKKKQCALRRKLAFSWEHIGLVFNSPTKLRKSVLKE